MRKIIKKTFISVLIAVFAVSPLRIDFFYSQKALADEAQSSGELDISEDTVWNSNTDLSMYDSVYVEYGATLTIEKGSQIAFRHLYIEGRIVAVGTMEEKIKLTKIPLVFEDSGPYDPRCYASPEATIEFNGSDNEDDPGSVFEFVEFSGMGEHYQYDKSDCPALSIRGKIKDFLLPTAYAASVEKFAPAVAFYGGKLDINNCDFKDNAYADVKVEMEFSDNQNTGSYLHIKNSNFQNNSQNTALISNVSNPGLYGPLFDSCFNECKKDYPDDYMIYGPICTPFCGNKAGNDPGLHDKTRVVLTNNWYGDASGPSVEGNSSGSGESVTGDYTLDGWSDKEIQNTDTKASNVLFLPGIEASRLYSDTGSLCGEDKFNPNKIWEPFCNDDVRKLYLDSDGKSLNNIYMKEGDVIGKTSGGSSIYQSFIDGMDAMKNKEKAINDWKAVSYDWRLLLDDILADGSIINTLKSLAGNSKTGKVTIVAHSNGGLLAKEIMMKLGDDDAKKLVDKIIFVAVPQVGTPAAVGGILHGEGQNILPVFDIKTARGLAENMPGAYNLLPSKKYFSTVETPILNFNLDSSEEWKNRYDSSISSKEKMDEFMSDDFRRVQSTDSDTHSPAMINRKMLEKANGMHNDLDNWVAPDGIKIIQIAGWGVPFTLSNVEYGTRDKSYCDELLCSSGVDFLNPSFNFTIDGDGVVVVPSALWMSGVERYWVNIDKYNKDHSFSTLFGKFGPEHKNIFEISNLLSFIKDNIENKTKSLSEYAYLSAEVPPSSDEKRLQYSLHSPLTFSLYDAKNRHTGIDKDNQIEETIPSTYFKQFGDVKYIFSDEDSSQHIIMDGYENGSFTFSVDELQGDKKLGSITFKDMPTTPKTKVVFDIASNLTSASKMKIDENGDGVFDYEVAPILGGTVTSANLVRIENDLQNSDNDDGDGSGNDKKKSKKTSVVAPMAGNVRMASPGTKLADAFILPRPSAYAGTGIDKSDKEDRRNVMNNDLENKEAIGMEELYSLIVLLLVIIIGFGWWKRELIKKV